MLIDVKCPHCGEIIQFDDSRSSAFCPFCGGEITYNAGFSQNQPGDPNLYISFNSINPAVGMVTRIVSTGEKNTYINGQTLSFHLSPGAHTVVLKIGNRNYNRDIFIPGDNTPVRIFASFNGRTQISIEQPDDYFNDQTTNNQVDDMDSFNVNDVFRDVGKSFDSAGSANYAETEKVTPLRQPTAKKEQPASSSKAVIAITAVSCVGFILLSLMIMFASMVMGSSTPRAQASYHQLYLDVVFENNLFLSTYDIDISLDGEKIGSVSDGKEFTILTDVKEGIHELAFVKAGSSSPREIKSLSVHEDTSYSCKLSHSSFKIGVKDELIEKYESVSSESETSDTSETGETVKNKICTPVNVRGMVLSEAIETLADRGFTNLRGEPFDAIKDNDNWIVMAQSAAPGSVIMSNDLIQLDCVRFDSYVNDSYRGKNISEIEALAKESGFDLKFQDSLWHEIDISSMDDEAKKDWVVVAAKQYTRADKTALATVVNISAQPLVGAASAGAAFAGDGLTASSNAKPTQKPTNTPIPTPSPTPTPRVAAEDNIIEIKMGAGDYRFYLGDPEYKGSAYIKRADPNFYSRPNVVFVSEDPEIATIEYVTLRTDKELSFKIKAVSVGETYVYAKTTNDKVYSERVKVTVNERVDAESVTLDIEECTLTLGERLYLTAEIYPEDTSHKQLTWSSSDNYVVAVSPSGLIKGVGYGEADVTATTTNGVSATCHVTVVAPTPTPGPTETPTPTPVPEQDDSGTMVYIPRTGHKYHSNPDCSRMKDPKYVTLEYAEEHGYGRCSKCW